MPQPEQLKQKKNIINQQTQNGKRNTRKTRINIQKKYSQIEFLPVRRNRIALQYATLKKDTSRYREEMQTKFKYPAETTARSRENSPPDVSVYQTAQITSNPRKWYKNNCNTRKTPHTYTQKEKPKTNSEQSNQNYYNFQLNLNKQAKAQYVNALQTEQSDAPCNFIKLYHPYLMKIALIKGISRKKKQHHPKISSIRNEDDLSYQNRRESSKFRR